MRKRKPTKFVINQRMLNARIRYRLLWDSSNGQTYVRKTHGALM